MTGTDHAHDARSALLDRDELPYANEVDAALSRMPARSARLLSLGRGDVLPLFPCLGRHDGH